MIVAVASARSAAAQPLTLAYQQVATRLIPGATAAFSLDPSRVGASAQDELVTIVGRGPGSTNVVVIVGNHTESFRVVVGDPPVTLLPGVRSGSSQGEANGFYEARFGSDPGLLQGQLSLSRREGDRSTELSIGGAAPFEDDFRSPFSVPVASFTVRTPTREVTLLDRVVSHSPLTISRSNIRGLHLRQGSWQVHAGYNFFSTFEHLLLPTNKEAVAGIGYRYRLDSRSSLSPNLFYFDGASTGSGRGPLGTLLYETRTQSDVKLTAELGMSRSLGGALEVELDRPTRRAWAKLRLAPSDLPSLTTDQQSGRQVEAGWISQGEESSLNATISSRRYRSATFDHTSSVASVDLQRYLTPGWAVHGGTGLSLFENALQSASSVHSFTMPLGTSLSRQNMSFGVDYQFSRETTRDLGGHLVRVSLSGSAGGSRFSLFGERQTQTPTARQILTTVPWLQPMLDRLGLAADTPGQLADLLRTNAELSAAGYANSVQIDVTPVRARFGASGGWSGSGVRKPQLFVSTLLNRDQTFDRIATGAVHSLTYSQRVGRAGEVFLTWSALCQNHFVSSSSCHPVLFASFRRALSSGPGLFMARRGHIDGVVFTDDDASGMYSPGLPPLAGVEIVLDNVRRVRTDSSGRFRFEDVSYGRHRVEALYVSDQPTFFTTPSPADVDAGASVSFGVALARSSLRGIVRTDAGIGLPGVLVHIASADRRTSVRTVGDGTFVAEGLAAGDYDVTLEAGSVPAGYPVETLAAQRVRVEQTTPGRASFVLRPYRSIVGRARVFDRRTGQYVALSGVTVELLPIRQRSVTDGNGQYVFRDLPSGNFTIVARHDGREHVVAVSVPAGPAFIRDMDVAVIPSADPAIAVARRASNPERPAVPVHAATDSGQHDRPRTEEASDFPTTNDVFTIEVAESTSVRHARAMVSELKDAGHAAYLVIAAPTGVTGPYHVRVGRYSTRTEADLSAGTLENALGWRMSVTVASPDIGVPGQTVSYNR